MIRRPERLEWIRKMNTLAPRPVKVTIGENTKIHPTVELGIESFSIERDEEGVWVRCKQYGNIRIGRDVEISPFSVVRRATLPDGYTMIGDGTKISAFVNIGHNSKVGKHVFIGPLTNLDGSVEVEDYAYIAPQVQINSHLKVGEGAFVGAGAIVTEDVSPGEVMVGVPAKPLWHRGNSIHSSFIHGENFSIGKESVIEEDVIVGDNVKIGHHCTLKSGTRFRNNIDFADYCKTTGICYVGNDVNIRTGSCISKSVIVEDKAFIGAGIMSSHTKHVYHHRPEAPKTQLITRIGYGSIIGSCVCLSAGVNICDNAIVGYGSLVTKDISEPAIYVGSPVKRIADIPPKYYIKKPDDYKEHIFTYEELQKYLPFYESR